MKPLFNPGAKHRFYLLPSAAIHIQASENTHPGTATELSPTARRITKQ